MKPTIYFVCTENSARSQMAEGWGRALLGDRYEVVSGGTSPGVLNPLAVRAMALAGIDISSQYAKPIDEARMSASRLVITLCGEAEETCPVTPPEVRRLHWPLPDPARASGTDEERLQHFCEVRDEIQRRMAALDESRR